MGQYNMYLEDPFNGLGKRPEVISGLGSMLKSDIIQDEFERIYHEDVKKTSVPIKRAASIEEILLQLRIKNNIRDIKFGIQGEQIFARCPFYRTDTDNKHLKIYMGSVKLYGRDLDTLSNNPLFVADAKYRLINKMDEFIKNNIEKFENKFGRVLHNVYL